MSENENTTSNQPVADPNLKEDSQDLVTELLAKYPSLTTAERLEIYKGLNRTDAEDLFLSLGAFDQAEIFRIEDPRQRRLLIRLLAPDDVADLIQELDDSSREEILSALDAPTRKEVTALLAYEEDEAGGLMSSRFIRLRPDMSADEAISYLRMQAKTNVEFLYYAFVTEQDQTLVGVISFRELFTSAPHKKVRELMTTEVVKIPVGLDQEEVAKIFVTTDFLALPVVDEWNHIKGIVTFDDIASVIEEEATEDIHKIGATESLDAPYMKTPFFELIRKRAGWLIVLFLGQTLTASFMGFYEGQLEKAVVLALFIPLIISSGGNSGSQASTLIVRALALGEILLRDWWRVLIREIGAGALLGLMLGVLGVLRIIFWPSSPELYGEAYHLIGVTVGASVLGCVLWGTISGSMLPFVLKRFALDPAAASAPFVATIVDVTGILIYFTVAGLVLAGVLL